MNQDQWTEVDAYLTGLFAPGDVALEDAMTANAAAFLPPYDVSPTQGKLLYLLARVSQARKVLEIGTLGGYSTIWLAQALPPEGRLVTLELDPRHAEVARRNLERAGFEEVVEVRVGPAIETLPTLEAEAPFDLIFIDADKPNNPEYLEWAVRLSRPGTLIVADNVIRGGAVVDATSEDPNVRGIRLFNERVAADPRLSATAIQTVGGKGYDGFALILVNHPSVT